MALAWLLRPGLMGGRLGWCRSFGPVGVKSTAWPIDARPQAAGGTALRPTAWPSRFTPWATLHGGVVPGSEPSSRGWPVASHWEARCVHMPSVKAGSRTKPALTPWSLRANGRAGRWPSGVPSAVAVPSALRMTGPSPLARPAICPDALMPAARVSVLPSAMTCTLDSVPVVGSNTVHGEQAPRTFPPLLMASGWRMPPAIVAVPGTNCTASVMTYVVAAECHRPVQRESQCEASTREGGQKIGSRRRGAAIQVDGHACLLPRAAQGGRWCCCRGTAVMQGTAARTRSIRDAGRYQADRAAANTADTPLRPSCG